MRILNLNREKGSSFFGEFGSVFVFPFRSTVKPDGKGNGQEILLSNYFTRKIFYPGHRTYKRY